ncbi:MAG: threonine aldolase family protein [Pseudomonadota bacterium]
MTKVKIELSSDTQTRPSEEMRRAMYAAEVADEQKEEDPTTNRLQDMTAELLGKEAALFLPTGTMCNTISILVHCNMGDEIICDRTAHIVNYEAGGPAAIAGASIRPIDGARGQFEADDVRKSLRPKGNRHAPQSRMVVIEQTSNGGGGSVWPLERIAAIGEVAREHGLAMHMDGARILNAVIAGNHSASAQGEWFDSLWLDLSKGLGCPIGAVLAGDRDFIREAWRWKHRLGGAMRQSGVIAAAGVYALEHHVERLAEDHANAKLLASMLEDIDGIEVEPVETNLIFFNVAGLGTTGPQFISRILQENGVRLGGHGDRIRAVTHLDVSKREIEAAGRAIRALACA